VPLFWDFYQQYRTLLSGRKPEAIVVARILKEQGSDSIATRAGRNGLDGELAYSQVFLTYFSGRLRNEAGIPTLVGSYHASSNEVNTMTAQAVQTSARYNCLP